MRGLFVYLEAFKLTMGSTILLLLLSMFPVSESTSFMGSIKIAVLASICLGLLSKIYRLTYKKLVSICINVLILASPLLIIILDPQLKIGNSRLVLETFAFGLIYTLLIGFFESFRHPSNKMSLLWNHASRITVWLLVGVESLVIIAYWGYYIVSRALLTPDIILTLYQTNIGEASAWWSLYGGIGKGISLVVLVTLACIIIRWLSRWNYVELVNSSKKINIVLRCLFLIFFVLAFRVTGNSVDRSGVRDTVQGIVSYQEYIRLSAENKNKKVYVGTAHKHNGLFILVIGESATRNHMGVYGYDRKNTPWLSEMKSHNKGVFLTQAYSNHTHTVPVLTWALTEKNAYNTVNLMDSSSIVQVANAGGFKTIWLSNQEQIGPYDTPISAIASSATEEIWVSNDLGLVKANGAIDGNIIEKLKGLNLQGNVLVVVHLMGSHWKYEQRYPRAFEQYRNGTNPAVDAYDNSILYTDYVLQHIYSYVSSLPNFQAMVYFSDHGEDIDKELGHEASKFTFTMARIPLVIFMSPNFEQKYPDIVMGLTHNKDVPFTNDLIFNLQCALMGLETKHTEQEFNLTSHQYNQNRDFKTLHGDKSIQSDVNR